MPRSRTGHLLALVTDAFGGRGGIALYNRNFLRAVCNYPGVERVTALPRSINYALEAMPVRLEYVTASSRGTAAFAWEVVRQAMARTRPDLIVCGHLHLLPFARLLQAQFGCPLVALTFGVEAWAPTSHRIANRLARDLEHVAFMRPFTLRRLAEWSGMRPRTAHHLPNCVDPAGFSVGPRRRELESRWGLEGKTVIMTAGRMDSSELELRKGFDEVLEAMPELLKDVPNLVYLAVGDGPELPNLEAQANRLGLASHVRFTGYVAEHEKADYYRLANVFAMPGSNPAFDTYPFRFVFLEALACGIPVVAAQALEDERNERDVQALLVQVDPADPRSVADGIKRALALASAGPAINPILTKYYYREFEARTHAMLADVLSASRMP